MNMTDFDLACELLPEGVTWGEAITPSIVKHIAEAARAAQARHSTDLSEQLREYACNNGYNHNDYADTMLAAATEIERLASQAQQDKEANSNRLTDAQIEDIGKEILNHGTHEWEGLQPWVYVFARRIASVSEQLLGNPEQFKPPAPEVCSDGGKMVQQTESQWISVEERLPEENCHLLVACEGGNVATTFYAIDHLFFDNAHGYKLSRKVHGKYSKHFELARQYGYKITHWMPLPPAPEGDKE